MIPEMKYEVRNAEAEKKLQEIGRMLADKMPAGFGFTLLIFTLGQEPNLFYLSSAKRHDMINAMREFVKKYEEN